ELPWDLYVEIQKRNLEEHLSFLATCLLERFLNEAGDRLSDIEKMPENEREAYLEKIVREVLSSTPR
ncbi:MAG: hypothetical protein JHC21_02305, partial [Thermocrinis sp.]|nr:hypothetical protein [Thermocrinis sp.]